MSCSELLMARMLNVMNLLSVALCYNAEMLREVDRSGNSDDRKGSWAP